jgi:hypothetical protein
MSLEDQAERTIEDRCEQPTTMEALELHRGWDAARRGEPLVMSNGSLWVEGWVNYRWTRGRRRGWIRH